MTGKETGVSVRDDAGGATILAADVDPKALLDAWSLDLADADAVDLVPIGTDSGCDLLRLAAALLEAREALQAILDIEVDDPYDAFHAFAIPIARAALSPKDATDD